MSPVLTMGPHRANCAMANREDYVCEECGICDHDYESCPHNLNRSKTTNLLSTIPDTVEIVSLQTKSTSVEEYPDPFIEKEQLLVATQLLKNAVQNIN